MAPESARILRTASSYPRSGKGCKPEFKGLDIFSLKFDFTVLGQAFLRNIQIAHDFKPGDDAIGIGEWDLQNILADAVDPVTDIELSFPGDGSIWISDAPLR